MPVVYRMSHVGNCPRALSAERLGLIPESQPMWLEKAAKEGKKHEDWIIEELQADDIAVVSRQLEVHLKITDEIELLGHIDGVLYDHDDTEKLLEIKSMSQYEFDRWMNGRFEAFPQYATQLTCYMTALRLGKARYIVHNRNSGYEDRQEIEGTPDNIERIKEYLIEIEKCVAEGKLYDRKFDENLIQCRRCTYKVAAKCIPEVVAEIAETPELIQAADEWREYKELAKEAEEKIYNAEQVFLKHSLAIGKMKWIFQQLGINVAENLPREYYDRAILEQIFSMMELNPALKQTKVNQKWTVRIKDYR